MNDDQILADAARIVRETQDSKQKMDIKMQIQFLKSRLIMQFGKDISTVIATHALVGSDMAPLLQESSAVVLQTAEAFEIFARRAWLNEEPK